MFDLHRGLKLDSPPKPEEMGLHRYTEDYHKGIMAGEGDIASRWKGPQQRITHDKQKEERF